jgi:hypothetical protein
VISINAAERLAAMGIAHVALFDDELPDSGAKIEDDAWESLIRLLEYETQPSLDPGRAAELRGRDSSAWEASLVELEGEYPAQVASFRHAPAAIRDAGLWVDWLTKAGATVDRFPSWSDFDAKATLAGQNAADAIGTYGLVLLDYQFGAPDGGATSTEIARQIELRTRSLAKSGVGVPILARFSAELVDQTEGEILTFLEAVGFPRSAYAVVPKALIRATGFEEVLLRELEKADTGRRLYALTAATKVALVKAVEEEAERLLFRLDAPSVRLLNERALEPEGVAEVEHWTSIIIALVSASLRESAEVASATGAILDLMATSSKPGMLFNMPALAEIENRLRFDYAVNRLLRPIDFGDIFVFDVAPARVALIVTQPCDMAVRAAAKLADGTDTPGIPEHPLLTLLLGSLEESGLPIKGTSDEWTTDFAPSSDALPTAAIHWNYGTQVMLPRAALDLVSLRPDGIAVLPAVVTGNNAMWTKSFRAYAEVVASTMNSRAQGGPVAAPIRFDSDDRKEEMPGLGAFAEYVCTPLDGTTDRSLGIRRVARLRPSETQRIAHRMNFSAGRVALATRLWNVHRPVTIRLMTWSGRVVGDIAGEALFLKDEHAKEVLAAIQVASANFQGLCRSLDVFAPFDAAAAESGEFCNLCFIMKAPNMERLFELKNQGSGVFFLKEKKPPQVTAPKAG